MLPEKMVKARLSFVAGKHVQQPNVVVVPAQAKTFPVTVEWSMESEASYVIGSHDPEDAHRWCVLDANLKQVMYGGEKAAGRKPPKKAEPMVTRMLHGGGADNPRQVTFEFTGAKLKSGAAYTLIASRHGVIAAGEFVAVTEPKPKKVAKKKAARKAKSKAKAKAKTAKKVVRKVKAAPKRKKRAARKKKTAARKKTA